VNNRAVTDRLLDVQGYDAVHVARFDQLLRVANGREQNYHNADLFAPGLRSPLLDLLSARYIVTPSGSDTSGEGQPLGEPRFSTVYDDGQTRVLRNERALPWAWVVHEAHVMSQSEALDLVNQGEIDPRRTVLLEPPLRSPLTLDSLMNIPVGMTGTDQGDRFDLPTVGSSGSEEAGERDTATVVALDADRLIVRTQTGANGVLVLSEVAYPGWVARVDGESVPIYVANGLLRAVPLPAGAHLVELQFESPTLQIGVVVSLATAALLVGCSAASLVISGRRRRLP
jgi:hypothetical protein